MEVRNSQQPYTDWDKLTRKTEKITHFLQHLTPDIVGDGRMTYVEDEDTLHSRSPFAKGIRAVQYVATIGIKGATFDATRDGFSKFHKRCTRIHDTIKVYKPQNRDASSRESIEYLFMLLELQKKIDGINEQGFEKLVANYRALHETNKATNLECLGREAFEKIYLSTTHLKGVLTSLFPDLKDDIVLKLSFSDCAEVLLARDQYRANLRRTVWTKEEGLRIPKELVEDCVKDASLRGSGPTAEALRVAANLIELPQKSPSVPTLQASQVWNPTRKDGKGVVGTCEKGDHLQNAYSRVDKNTGHLMISCGAFNTQQKAKELLEIIKSFEFAKIEGPFVVHQLDSFYYSKDSIRYTHAQIPFLIDQLQKMAHKSPIYHLNTCFDANATSRSEEGVFDEINHDSLRNIADLILSETKKLNVVSPSVDNIIGFEKNQQTLLTNLDSCIKELRDIEKPTHDIRKGLLLYQLLQDIFLNQKNSAKPLSTTAEIERYLLLYRMLNIKPIFVCDNGLDKSGVVRSLAEAQYRLEELVFEGVKENNDDEEHARLEAQEKLYRLLQNIEEWKGELFEKQKAKIAVLRFPLVSDLADQTTREAALAAHQQLKAVAEYRLEKLFEELFFEGSKENNNGEEDVRLEVQEKLYRLLQNIEEWKGELFEKQKAKIAELQFPPVNDLEDQKTHQAALAAYQQLNEEAQKRLEELFSEGSKENNSGEEQVRLEAPEKLYRLLQNIKKWEGELFEKQKAKIAEFQLPLVSDLADQKTRHVALAAHQKLDQNLRNKLRSMFTGDNDKKADDLFHTQVYLELVFGSLLLEQEKTLNSSGALGYQFYDYQGWFGPHKNPHPIERWPLFTLTTQGMPIQLLETHEPSRIWNNDLLTLTKAGIDLIHRLGLLR